MKNNFPTFFDHLIVSEGYYSKDPTDIGGETLFGVSRKYHPNWKGWVKWDNIISNTGSIPNREVAFKALKSDLMDFYKENFWDELKCDEWYSGVDIFLADSAVNLGGVTEKYLQEAVGAVQDGIIGPNTISKVNSVAPERLLGELHDIRSRHYMTETGQAQREKYGKGWAARNRKMYNFCLEFYRSSF